jgi:transcriptional regulator with XRE-family HTH domain
MITFGEKIRELRVEKGITQKTMANCLSVTVPTLSHWECNYQEPSFKDLQNLSKFFGVSTDYLLGLENDFGIKTVTNATTTAPMGDHLTPEERELLQNYRTLNPNFQKLIKQSIETLHNTSLENNVKINNIK